jgi:hypothetical protein
MHKVKCYVCKEQFDTDKIQAVRHSSTRYSHATCEPDNTDFVPMPPSKDSDEYRELQKAINVYLGKSKNSFLVNKQIKQYTQEGLSYEDIKMALDYFYKVKKGGSEKARGGIGIVPYILEEALQYYNVRQKIDADNEEKTKTLDNETIKKEYRMKQRQRRRPPQSQWRDSAFNLDIFNEEDK